MCLRVHPEAGTNRRILFQENHHSTSRPSFSTKATPHAELDLSYHQSQQESVKPEYHTSSMSFCIDQRFLRGIEIVLESDSDRIHPTYTQQELYPPLCRCKCGCIRTAGGKPSEAHRIV